MNKRLSFQDSNPETTVSVYFIWQINRTITCVILGGYVMVFGITNLLLKGLYRMKERILINEEQLNHYLVRGFMEMLVFRMARQFPGEIRKADAAGKEIVRAKVKMNLIHEAFFTIFALLVAVLDIGILLYAWYSREVSVGAVVALISLLDNAYTPIAIFNVLYVQYKLDQAAFRRFEEFLQLKEDCHLDSGRMVADLQGKIQVENLTFGYGERKVLKDISLTIKPGEKVAFVGESGSGKSTLAKLLAGLLKYDKGSIRVDGMEIRELCLNSLYGHMSYISQDSPIFDGTLRENLVFDRDTAEEEQREALRRVLLMPLFETMSQGLETEIGERGAVLSGGERQRLALARLWFEKKEITILDEATSAMDNLTEQTVMDEVIHMLENRTVIAIAHRLHSIAGFDKIVVFHQGKIVGLGTFEELMRENSYFMDLYRASVQ